MSDLETKTREIRGIILDQVVAFGNGHIASAFSCLEILLTLYHRVLKVNAANPTWPDRDRLILSKGHGVSALYAILADLGFFPKEWLTTPQDGNPLGGHADHNVPGIDWSTGSLGHGLSVAAGMALAAKMDKKDYRVFCILGDGELQEGSVWEAAMFAAHHKLDNLITIIDRNHSQSCGRTESILDLEELATRWWSFGWFYVDTDGHSISDLSSHLNNLAYENCDSPKILIADTNKGHGVSFIETGDGWHTRVVSQEELVQAKHELGLISWVSE